MFELGRRTRRPKGDRRLRTLTVAEVKQIRGGVAPDQIAIEKLKELGASQIAIEKLKELGKKKT